MDYSDHATTPHKNKMYIVVEVDIESDFGALNGPMLYVHMSEDPTRYNGAQTPHAVNEDAALKLNAKALGVITSIKNIFATLYEVNVMTEGTVRYMPPSADLEVPVMAKYKNGLINLGHGTAYASPAIFNPVPTD